MSFRSRLIRALVIWAGAIAIGAAFGTLQLSFGCDFFQRGGSMVVAYGLLIGFVAARARFEYGIQLDALQSEQIAISELMWAGDNGHAPARQAARHALERKMAAVTERLDALSRASARVQHMYIVEAPIVFVGTIIWGFGDLIVPSTGCVLPFG